MAYGNGCRVRGAAWSTRLSYCQPDLYGVHSIAMLTFDASSQMRLSASFRRRACGSTRFCFRTTVTSSARAAESAESPVSPAGRKRCVGNSL